MCQLFLPFLVPVLNCSHRRQCFGFHDYIFVHLRVLSINLGPVTVLYPRDLDKEKQTQPFQLFLTREEEMKHLIIIVLMSCD